LPVIAPVVVAVGRAIDRRAVIVTGAVAVIAVGARRVVAAIDRIVGAVPNADATPAREVAAGAAAVAHQRQRIGLPGRIVEGEAIGGRGAGVLAARGRKAGGK